MAPFNEFFFTGAILGLGGKRGTVLEKALKGHMEFFVNVYSKGLSKACTKSTIGFDDLKGECKRLIFFQGLLKTKGK